MGTVGEEGLGSPRRSEDRELKARCLPTSSHSFTALGGHVWVTITWGVRG